MLIQVKGAPDKFVRECATGHKLLEDLRTKYHTAAKRERVVAEHARELAGHRTVEGLGKCVSSLPAWEWFRLVQERGIDEIQSREFQKHLRKTHPELCPNRA